MKILSVTLNPVYDLFYTLPEFRPFRENLASSVSVFTGGKGINVTRALISAGSPYAGPAFLLLGRDNAPLYESIIVRDGVDARFFRTPGRIRENLTFLTEGIPETRVCVNDFSADTAVLSEILDAIRRETGPDDVLVCSGKFPGGLAKREMAAFFEALKTFSPRVALDSNSFSAEETLALAPWLIKPNEEEIEKLIGRPCPTLSDRIEAASTLHRGGIPHVLLSLGGAGAVYCGELGFCRASVPKIEPLSTIGSGDSTLAGFVSAFLGGEDAAGCLTRACAFGTAACLEPGTNPPRPDRISDIARQIRITEIETAV